MAIEGTGIKTPSNKSSKKATAFLGNFQKKADEKFIKQYETKQEGGNQNSDFETDRYNKLKQKYGDQFSSDASTNFFSPGGGAFDSRNNVETAMSDASGDYNTYLKSTYDFDTDSRTYRELPGNMKRILKESYNDDSLKFREGTQINQAPTKEKTIGERVADFTGNVVNTLTGTQSAVAQTKETGKGLFGGSVPEGTYSQFSPTSKPQYQINREKNRPNQNTNVAEAGAEVKFGSVNLNAGKGVESPKTAEVSSGDTSFSSYVRGAGEGQERGNTRLAEARQIAKRNPNVTINKSTGKAEATNNTGVAKAQAMAVNRKLSGTKPKSGKERAQDAAKARKAAGPNRKMSDGQQTRSQAGASARTAQGNRARVRSNARKRAQAAAKRRRKKKSKKK